MKLKPNSEDQEQALFFEWLSWQKEPEYQMAFAIPNGGKRHISTALRLKATGVKSGVPDIMLPIMRGKHGAMFIEMKSVKGRISPKQTKWHKDLREQGYKVVVCYSCEDAVEEIKKYLCK